MQRGQKPPEGTLRRQPQHLQDAGQHRLTRQKLHVMQPRETHIYGQHHGQYELVHGHGPRHSFHRQRLFDQLLESQLLQHGRYR
jgi:hypothetical protein